MSCIKDQAGLNMALATVGAAAMCHPSKTGTDNTCSRCNNSKTSVARADTVATEARTGTGPPL